MVGDVLNAHKTGFPEGEIGRRFGPRTHKAENVPGALIFGGRTGVGVGSTEDSTSSFRPF
jgi:hypothetical protein